MLTSTTHTRPDATVVRLSGVLNARTYQQVRDSVIKVAVDDVAAVIVDINDLEVRDDQSWAVFTSARWLVHQWPEVPIALVSGDSGVRKRLTDRSVARYVPVYDTLAAAGEAIRGGKCGYRHRAREKFGPHSSSVNSALIFVHEYLMAWSMRDKIPVASTVVTVFAENALSYADDGFDVRLEGTVEGGRHRGVRFQYCVGGAAGASARSSPCGIGHRLRALPSLGQHPDVRRQNGLGTHRSRRHFRRDHRTGALIRSRRRRERSARARTARRTAPRTGRGGPRRPTSRAQMALAGHGW